MFTKSLALLAGLSILSAAAPGQVTFVPKHLHESVVTIGDGINSFGHFNGVNHAPFAKALAKLPNGGTIEVLTGNWTFGQPVTIAAHGITIRGSSGANLIPGGTQPIGLFDVQGDRVRITGIQISTTTPLAGQNAIRALGETFSLDHCVFRALGGALDFRFVELGDGINFRRGSLIEGNSFLFSSTSAGITGLRARLGISLRMVGNEFTRIGNTGGGLCRYAVVFETESKGVIVGNSFQNLGTATDKLDAVIWSNAEGEGHHFAITGNFLEFCIADQTIQLMGGRFCTITGNVFGRMTSAVNGVVRLQASVGGAKGESNVISGNQFHNVTLGVFVSGQQWTGIHGNQFTICSSRQVEVLASAQGLSIVGNQFAASGTQSIPEAIRTSGGSDHMVHDNVAVSNSPSIGFVQVLTSTTVDQNVLDNWKS